jgi:hypothetical protein
VKQEYRNTFVAQSIGSIFDCCCAVLFHFFLTRPQDQFLSFFLQEYRNTIVAQNIESMFVVTLSAVISVLVTAKLWMLHNEIKKHCMTVCAELPGKITGLT